MAERKPVTLVDGHLGQLPSGDQLSAGAFIGNKIYPASDSTTAVQVCKADGSTNVLNVDTTNGWVGIGTTSPTVDLEIVNAEVGPDKNVLIHVDQANSSGGSAYLDLSSKAGDSKYRMLAYRMGGVYIQAGNYDSTGNKPLYFSGYYGNQGSTVKFDFAHSIFTGNLGLGTTSPNAKLESLTTTEQLRLSYDASHYCSFTVSSSGDLTIAPNGGDVNVTGALTASSSVTASQFKLSALNTAPSSASDTGTTGEIRIANGYIYVCVATDTWQRVALSSW